MKKMFFRIALSMTFMLCITHAFAQKFNAVPKSSGDVIYFPKTTVFDGKSSPVIKVTYFRPLKKGREIFGVLEPFGKVWRTGANNETEIKFFKDVKIGETAILAGTYSLFTIPDAKEWTIIINKQTDRWGAYSYDEKLDVVRVKVALKKPDAVIEAFSIMFNPTSNGASMVMGWDNALVEVPITF